MPIKFSKNDMHGALFLLTTLFSTISFASPPLESIDDTEISANDWSAAYENVPIVLPVDHTEQVPQSDGIVVEFVREDHGVLTPIEGLPVHFEDEEPMSTNEDGWAWINSCTPGQTRNGSVELRYSHFNIGNGSDNYRIEFQALCGERTRLIFDAASHGGQALGIWQIAKLAHSKLDSTVGLRFWHNPISFIWPAQSDYYSWGQVHITRGDHWDVVGHELGHAIYDQAEVGEARGGQHYIDRCYNKTLALSEGWASYFSAWLSLNPADADAHFEFMVPRRAPIGIENIPEDVCKGSGNEWRVAGFFWDLIDVNDDSESADETFALVWNTLAGSHSRSAEQAASKLTKAGIGSDKMTTVWNLNFGSNPAHLHSWYRH